ncbi:MAG: D-2-hydroxyacid dehydrogenase [Prevotella sp.]|nr:D-2-hydroxyacid dehydrogenase [Prevotella sp.]
MNIVVLDGYAANPGDLSWDAMKELGQLTVYDRTPAEEVIARSQEADIVLTNKVVLTADIISKLPHLKYIGVLATGYNVVDTEAARLKGIVVTNIPSYSSDSVAQLTFAHILNISNRVAHYAQLNRQGVWSSNKDFCYWDTPLFELAGKTLGIVGLGSIGMKVANIGRQLGMDIFAMTSKNSSDLPQGIQKTTLDGLLAVSDVLTLHCPLTPQTRHLINQETLSRMKQGAILINTGRGPLVDEAAVAQALQSGHLMAYGADVMSQEPPAADNPLLACPNAYLTPHIAWATYEARVRLMQIATDNVKAFIAGSPVNVVNK